MSREAQSGYRVYSVEVLNLGLRVFMVSDFSGI
jgi:hypothetical protein